MKILKENDRDLMCIDKRISNVTRHLGNASRLLICDATFMNELIWAYSQLGELIDRIRDKDTFISFENSQALDYGFDEPADNVITV